MEWSVTDTYIYCVMININISIALNTFFRLLAKFVNGISWLILSPYLQKRGTKTGSLLREVGHRL